MVKTTKRQIDMTSGPLLGKIILFTIPLILSGILQLLFNAADVVVVGQWAGTESLAAVSSNGPLVSLVVNLFIGLGVGANVVVARAIGAKNMEKSERAVHTAILLSLIGGLFVAVFGWFVSPYLLKLMKVDPDVIAKSTLYVRIYFLGAPVLLLYNFGAAILRAKGDTKRPLVFLIISGFINVGLNLLFVIVFNMDVAGVAIATITAQAFSAVAVIICLIKEKDYCKLRIKRLRITREILEIARIGLPAGIYSSFFSIANMAIQSSINDFGKVVMAGSATAGNLEGFVYTSMNAVYNAAITFTGQNYGAKKYKRIGRVVLCCLGAVTVVGLALGGAMAIFAPFFSRLYSPDADVIAVAVERLRLLMPLYFLCGIMEIFVGVLRGMGYSVIPMVVTFFGACVLRVVWVFTVFAKFHRLTILYISYPISWIITLLADGLIFLIVYKRLLEKSKIEEELASVEETKKEEEIVENLAD
jgi:putative MATE family efflux protein